jgi:hypothetical protein
MNWEAALLPQFSVNGAGQTQLAELVPLGAAHTTAIPGVWYSLAGTTSGLGRLEQATRSETVPK